MYCTGHRGRSPRKQCFSGGLISWCDWTRSLLWEIKVDSLAIKIQGHSTLLSCRYCQEDSFSCRSKSLHMIIGLNFGYIVGQPCGTYWNIYQIYQQMGNFIYRKFSNKGTVRPSTTWVQSSRAFQRYMTAHILLHIGMSYTVGKLMNSSFRFWKKGFALIGSAPLLENLRYVTKSLDYNSPISRQGVNRNLDPYR